MRVLIVIGALEIGGAERQAILLSEYLKNCGGYQVLIVGFGYTGRVIEECNRKGIPCHPYPNAPCADPYNKLYRYKNTLQFARNMRHFKPDCIISFTSSANIACALTWRLIGAQICIWSQRTGGAERSYLCNWPESLLKPSIFTSNSSAGKQELLLFSVPEYKIHVIYNGKKLNKPDMSAAEWKQCLGLPEHSFIVCMLAHLESRKDHESLLYAWKKNIDEGKFSDHVYLLFAGRDGDTSASLRMLVQDMQLQDTVHFLGEVNDVSGLLHTADVGIHIAHHEGLPNAILEGMLAGVPYVATDLPGVRDIFGDTSSNILVPPGDVVAISKALEIMFADVQLREKCGRENKLRAEQFTPEKMGNEFVKVIEQCYIKASHEKKLYCFYCVMRDFMYLFLEEVIGRIKSFCRFR